MGRSHVPDMDFRDYKKQEPQEPDDDGANDLRAFLQEAQEKPMMLGTGVTLVASGGTWWFSSVWDVDGCR